MKYEVKIIKPGIAMNRKYTESNLRDAMDSLEGITVTNKEHDTDIMPTIGLVTDVWYDDGIMCEVDISDEEYIRKINERSLYISPQIIIESDDSDSDDPIIANEIEFDRLFLTAKTIDLVGKPETTE